MEKLLICTCTAPLFSRGSTLAGRPRSALLDMPFYVLSVSIGKKISEDDLLFYVYYKGFSSVHLQSLRDGGGQKESKYR